MPVEYALFVGAVFAAGMVVGAALTLFFDLWLVRR
jgi:hypothetical protein